MINELILVVYVLAGLAPTSYLGFGEDLGSWLYLSMIEWTVKTFALLL